MARYKVPNISVHRENRNHTHVFHFNLEISYREYLLQMRNQFSSYSEMLLFLLSKYSERLKRISMRKSSCTKIYQPLSGSYQGVCIRITYEVHQMLVDYSQATGLSMSYIIRLLIEWENGDYHDPIGTIDFPPI